MAHKTCFRELQFQLGLINFFLQFRLFFTKIEKIADTRNGKDAKIGITSFLYKISTQFLRVW